MTDTTPVDKVWARYDGRDFPAWDSRTEWIEVEDCGNEKHFSVHGRIWDWEDFQRHVGPTPPDAKESAMQSLDDLEQAFDAAPPHVRDALHTALSKPITPEMWRIREEYVATRKAQKTEIMDDTVDWYVHNGSVKRPKRVENRAVKLPKIKIVIDGVKYTAKLKRLPTRK